MRRMDKLSVFRDPADTPIVPVAAPEVNYDGLIVAFDQSLVHTGWVEVDFHGDSFKVQRYGTLVGGSVKGFEATLGRGAELYWEITRVIEGTPFFPRRRRTVICEMPSVQGQRNDSALIGALMVRMVVPWSVLVSRQHAATLLAGSPNAPKKEIAQALRNFWPGLPELGEHESDALALAVAWAHDRIVEDNGSI